MMKYILMKYLRLSSEDVDLDGHEKYESNSIANQRTYLDDFIAKIPEFSSCNVLEAIDDGWTGTNFKRPGITQVLELAQHGKIHCIIVKDLSRFGRNYLEVGDYLEQIFPTWGIRFISINDMYDSADFSGTTSGISIAFRSLIAEMYSQDLSAKVHSAKTALSKCGKSCAPFTFYGYLNNPADRHRFIIDEPAAAIVRLIFDLYEQGLSISHIARKLNDDHVQTANERKQEQGAKRNWLRKGNINMWHPDFVSRILRDERYTGTFIAGKAIKIFGSSSKKYFPPTEWITVPNAIPSIITVAQFYRVKEMRSAKARNQSQKSDHRQLHDNPYLFRQKIYCGYCGKLLERHKRANQICFYRCITPKVKDGLGCFTGGINENAINNTVLTVLKQQAQLANTIKTQKNALSKNTALTADEMRNELQHLKQLIEKANAEKMTLWEKYHSDSLTKEGFQTTSLQLTEQITIYTNDMNELNAQIQKIDMESGQENTFVERFSTQVAIQELTPAVVDEFIKVIHVYTADRIEIVLNYVDQCLG